MGRQFVEVPWDVKQICEDTGYGKSRVYQALNNLVTYGIFKKVSSERKNQSCMYLVVTEDVRVPTEKFVEEESRFHSSGNELFEAVPNSLSDKEDTVSIPVETGLLRSKTNGTNYNRKNYSTGTDGITLEELRNSIELYNSIEWYNSKELRNNVSKLVTGLEQNGVYNKHTHLLKAALDAFPDDEVLDRNVRPVLKRLAASLRASVTKKAQGYHAKDFASPKGLQTPENVKYANRWFVKYYMHRIYKLKSIDYFIPTSNMKKYYARAKTIIELLGSVEKAKDYIDWFLRSPSFEKSGYGLDLLISTPVLNQFNTADPKDTRKGLSKEMFMTAEEAKKHKGGKLVDSDTFEV